MAGPYRERVEKSGPIRAKSGGKNNLMCGRINEFATPFSQHCARLVRIFGPGQKFGPQKRGMVVVFFFISISPQRKREIWGLVTPPAGEGPGLCVCLCVREHCKSYRRHA